MVTSAPLDVVVGMIIEGADVTGMEALEVVGYALRVCK
jgi:hypothetical protein